jgi:hypothetical protein
MRAPTLPSFVHQWYEDAQVLDRRFKDLPARRGFVAYQIRLLNSLIAQTKGRLIGSAELIIAYNPYFVESDFDDLLTLITDLDDATMLDDIERELLYEKLIDLRDHYRRRPYDFKRAYR